MERPLPARLARWREFGVGRLTEPTAAVQPSRREPLFMPHCCHSPRNQARLSGSGPVTRRDSPRSKVSKVMRLHVIFKKGEKRASTSGRRDSRCTNGFKAGRNHQNFRGAIDRGQEDKRGQDNRHGYKDIVETTTESVEPLGQISPSLAHGRGQLTGSGSDHWPVRLERSMTAPVASKATAMMRLRWFAATC